MYYNKNGSIYSGEVEMMGGIPFKVVGRRKERVYTQTEFNTQIVRDRIKIKGGSKAPQTSLPVLTERDYELGKVIRYIIQKRVDPFNTIVEITPEQRTQYSENNKRGLDSRIYRVAEVPWLIVGDIEYVTYTNIRTVQVLETAFPGLSNYLKDPLQFYRQSF